MNRARIRSIWLMFAAVAATGAVLPGGCASTAKEGRPFIHPGLLHSEQDFERMQEKVVERQ